MKRLIKNSFLVRKTIGLFIISLFFSFFVYMGGSLVIGSSKTFDQLNHIEGRITDTRFIKHKYSGKFRAGYKSVLVLSVEGASDEFGFMEGSKAYKKLFDLRRIGKNADIYYDGNGKRIEEGVTLHIFDVKIGNYQVVEMADIQRSDRLWSTPFFSAALIFLIMAIMIIKKKEDTEFETIEDDD